MTQNSLKEKARKVFKGLDEADYAILKFFYQEGPTSKYKVSRYFEGYEQQKPHRRISRATVYRKIQNLKDKQFLEVIRRGKFERGSLKSDVEILSAETLKGNFAVLGSGVDPNEVFKAPPKKQAQKSSVIRKMTSYEKQHELYSHILDSLIEVNEDLTDKKGNLNLMHFLNTLLLVKRPDYMCNLLNESVIKGNKKIAVKEFLKLVKFLEKDLKEGVES